MRNRFMAVAGLLVSVGVSVVMGGDVKVVVPGDLASVKLEGPAGDAEGNVYFCNMAKEGLTITYKSANQGTIGIIKPDDSYEVFTVLPEGRRGNGMRFHPNGNLIIADQLGKGVLELNVKTKEVSVYHQFPDDVKGSPNDIAIAKDGTVYVSFWKDGLWRISADKQTVEMLAKGFHNGISLSPDEKRLISEKTFYDIGEDGSFTKIEGKKLNIPEEFKGRRGAFTDGMRVDAEGNIYLAHFGGNKADPNDPKGKKKIRFMGNIHVFNPEGEYVRSIELPKSSVTNVTFGGKDGKTLYVTMPGGGGVAKFQNDIPGREFAK